MVEFLVPGVRVVEIRGPEVASWSQVAGRVHVWLRKLVKEGELEWIGTAAPIPVGQPSPFSFDASNPKLVDVRLVSESVRIRPVDGWAVSVERDRGWIPVESADVGLAFQTTTVAAQPVRIILTPAPRTARADSFGWLSPSTRPRLTTGPPEPHPADPADVTTRPTASTTTPLPHTPSWVWPVSAAVGWCSGLAIVAALLVRFPRSTWPEQFGLVAGLFGMAVVGFWWVGVVAWSLARIGWLAEAALASSGRATTQPP
jgi:hypothetical protein